MLDSVLAKLGSKDSRSNDASADDRLKTSFWRRFSHVGTIDYLAPELLMKGAYGPASDWWSLGVVAYELMTGVPPFDAESSQETYKNILHRKINWPETMSTTTRDFISSLLNLSSMQRLGSNGAHEIKAHPFFHGVDFDRLHLKRASFRPNLASDDDTSNFDGKCRECGGGRVVLWGPCGMASDHVGL